MLPGTHAINGHAKQPFMTPYPILFNQTPESLCRIGARGGRARARNRRLRQITASVVPAFTVVYANPLK